MFCYGGFLAPHLLLSSRSMANFYFLHSGSGACRHETAYLSASLTQPRSDCVWLRRRSVDGAPRGRTCHAAHYWRGNRNRSCFFARWEHDCLYRRVRRKHRCVYDSCDGRRSLSRHLSSRSRYRRGMVPRWQTNTVSLQSTVGEPLHADIFRSRPRRRRHPLAATDGLSGTALPRWRPYCLFAAATRLRI